MFGHSIYKPSIKKISDAPVQIDSVEVQADKSILITMSLQSPDEFETKKYIIDKRYHIDIALKVLCGEFSAKDGIEELCFDENLNESWAANQFELGKVLGLLVYQSMLGNKKIKYLDDEVIKSIQEKIGPKEKRFHFVL